MSASGTPPPHHPPAGPAGHGGLPAQGGPPPISPAGGLPTPAAAGSTTAAAGSTTGAAGAADETRTGHRAAARAAARTNTGGHRGTKTTPRTGGRRRAALPLPQALSPRRPRRRRGAARGLAVVAALASLTLFVVSMAGWATVKRADSKISRVAIHHTGKRPPPAPPGTVNYLLVGADNRAGVAGERSDTIMLAHLDTNGSTTLLSFPRDTLVQIPGHGRNKINAAISIGGPGLLMSTLESLTNISIDHYLSIDFNGFKTMSDAVGGVNVCVSPVRPGAPRTNNLVDVDSGFRGRYGTNHVSGDQALGYVRARHSLPYGDLDRIKRQQEFLGSLFQQATKSKVLLNPVKVVNLLDALSGSLQVDSGTSNKDLINLAERLRGVSTGAVTFETIPVHTALPADGAVDDQGQIPPFGDVQIFEPGPLATLLAPLRGAKVGPGTATPGTTPAPGATATPTPSPTPALTVPPAQVRVEVLNGTRQKGLAATAAQSLAARGFAVAGSANATTKGLVTTQVRYGPTRAESAATLASYVPGATLVPDATLGGTVELVLGSSFAGVSTGGATSATPADLAGGGAVQAAADIVPAAVTDPGPIEAPASCPY